MKYHSLTFAILLAAVVLAIIGKSGAGVVLLGLAAALELWFWVRVLRGKRTNEPRHQ